MVVFSRRLLFRTTEKRRRAHATTDVNVKRRALTETDRLIYARTRTCVLCARVRLYPIRQNSPLFHRINSTHSARSFLVSSFSLSLDMYTTFSLSFFKNFLSLRIILMLLELTKKQFILLNPESFTSRAEQKKQKRGKKILVFFRPNNIKCRVRYF